MNGIIVIDKPSGKTSHDIVSEVKKILAIKKAGHTGTLDPLATGVLPVCINEGTKLAQFYMSETKEYRTTMLLGVETDTLDSDGKIVALRQINVGHEAIRQELEKMVGEIQQTPPQYSALKFKGKPLYQWARKGLNVAVEPRTVRIFSLKIEEIALPSVSFTICCSKGTYIRSICADVGHALGCGACMTGLRRTKSGEFSDGSALSLENITDEEKKLALARHVIPMVDALPHFASVEIDDTLVEKIRSGHQPTAGNIDTNQISFLDEGAMIKFISRNNLIAIGRLLYSREGIDMSPIEQPVVKIMRVFNQ